MKVHSLLHILESVDAASQILRHLARVNGVNAGSLQTLGKPGSVRRKSEMMRGGVVMTAEGGQDGMK